MHDGHGLLRGALAIAIISVTWSAGAAAATTAPDAWASALIRLHETHEIVRVVPGERGSVTHVHGLLSAPVTGGGHAAAALDFIAAHAELFGLLMPSAELVEDQLRTDALGMTHVGFHQRYHGIPVLHGELRAHFDAQGVLRTVSGTVLPELGVPTSPTVDADDPAAELVVARVDGSDHLAWRSWQRTTDPPGRWEILIDATTGELVQRVNRIHWERHLPGQQPRAQGTSEIGSGIGVMGDVKDRVETTFDTDAYYLENTARTTDNDPWGVGGRMQPGASIATFRYFGGLPGALHDDNDNVWDDPSQASAVDAHVYATWVYDFLNLEMDRNGHDGTGSPMLSTVEDRTCQNNAYWDGTQVAYCRVGGGNRPMPGDLDIVAHEWGHAVTEFSSNLVYAREPGALNESFSDMIGVRLLHAHGDPRWRMGEHFNGTGFRDLSDPRLFGDPDCRFGPGWIDVSNCTPGEQNDWCGVHSNNGVPNKMFYLLSEGGVANGQAVEGIGIDDAFRIAYRANAYYWTELTDFDAAHGDMMAAADDLDPSGTWSEQVDAAWKAVCVGASSSEPPVAVPGGPYQGGVGNLFTFDGTASYDPRGLNLIGYSWEFGDDEIGWGAIGYHVYEAEGTYTVTLHVVNQSGLIGEGITLAQVGPPSAIELAEFQLGTSQGAVSIYWRAAVETDHLGYHIERRDLAGERFERITAALVRSSGAHAHVGGDPLAYEYVDRTAVGGRTYHYRLEAVDLSGRSEHFDLGTIAVASAPPTRTALLPNYPNPFNPRTTIPFQLEKAARVHIRIYDSSGHLVRVLADERFAAGRREIEWDGRDDAGRAVGSGIYHCRLHAGAEISTRRIVLVR